MRGPLPKAKFDWIFARVPAADGRGRHREPGRGVLLSLREIDPCKEMWHLRGGTVRVGERAVNAVKRVAHADSA